MKIKLIVTALLLGGHLYANAQTSVSDTIRSQHTFRLHNNTEVTESKTVVVTEEPAQKKKKNKVKVRKPKNMEYRLALLEVEFEMENYRKKILRRGNQKITAAGINKQVGVHHECQNSRLQSGLHTSTGHLA